MKHHLTPEERRAFEAAERHSEYIFWVLLCLAVGLGLGALWLLSGLWRLG